MSAVLLWHSRSAGGAYVCLPSRTELFFCVSGTGNCNCRLFLCWTPVWWCADRLSGGIDEIILRLRARIANAAGVVACSAFRRCSTPPYVMRGGQGNILAERK